MTRAESGKGGTLAWLGETKPCSKMTLGQTSTEPLNLEFTRLGKFHQKLEYRQRDRAPCSRAQCHPNLPLRPETGEGFRAGEGFRGSCPRCFYSLWLEERQPLMCTKKEPLVSPHTHSCCGSPVLGEIRISVKFKCAPWLGIWPFALSIPSHIQHAVGTQ